MNATSASLLGRLTSTPLAEDWNRLVDLYQPMIRSWLARHGLQEQDAADVSQEVLSVVVKRLPEFRHNQRVGAFRTWLRNITTNCLRDHWRAQKSRPRATGDSEFQQTLASLEDDTSGLSQLWNREHDLHVMKRLFELIRPLFEEKTWLAFQQFALEGQPAAAVAKSLGLTVNAVFIAKSRILAQLRTEGEGLLDLE